jgi:hypothetical protein
LRVYKEDGKYIIKMNKSQTFLIFLVLFSQIMTLRREKSHADFEIRAFTSLIHSWRSAYKSLHILTNDLFNLASGHKGKKIFKQSIPTKNFLDVVHETFPVDESAVKQIRQEFIDEWVLIKDDSELGETIDRQTAYELVQSKVEYISMSGVYANSHFESKGEFKLRAENIVESVTQSLIDFSDLAQQLFEKADVNHNGQIDFEEFKASFSFLLDGEDREKAKEVFDRFDADHSGYLDNLEVHHALGIFLWGKIEFYILKGSEHQAAKHSDIISGRHQAREVNLGHN